MIDYNKVSRYDEEVLHQSNEAMFCTDIDENLAEDEEVRKYLYHVAVMLHHKEEAMIGDL